MVLHLFLKNKFALEYLAKATHAGVLWTCGDLVAQGIGYRCHELEAQQKIINDAKQLELDERLRKLKLVEEEERKKKQLAAQSSSSWGRSKKSPAPPAAGSAMAFAEVDDDDDDDSEEAETRRKALATPPPSTLSLLLFKWKGGTSTSISWSTILSTFSPKFFYQEVWNPMRSLKTIGYATCLYTPIGMRWYKSLDVIFPNKDFKSVMQRVASDQLMWAPATMLLYFGFMSTFENDGFIRGTLHKIRFDLFATLATNWMVWLPVQILNVFLIPFAYWGLVVGVVSIPWTGYISYRNVEASRFQILLAVERSAIEEREEKMKEFVRSATERRPTKLIR